MRKDCLRLFAVSCCMLFMTGCIEGKSILEVKYSDVPQTEAPQTAAPQTEAPQTAAPQTEAPQTTAPQTTASQTTEPQTEDEYDDCNETVYAAEAVNVRTAPSTESEIMGVLDSGDSVLRTGYNSDWSRVEYNGRVCYIASRYLTTELPQTTASVQSWSGDIAALSNKMFTGTVSQDDRDDKNVPNGCYYLTRLYSKYNADFVQDVNKNIIYLTMDEGYEAGFTPAILDTLKEKNVKAVFFITKQFLDSNPEYVQRMIDEGHVVGNHTCAHPQGGMPSLSIEAQKDDIMTLHKLVKERFGYDMKLFRFPEGLASEQSMALVSSLGYKSVFWSFGYYDYDSENQMDPAQALNLCVKNLHPGAIYLLHAKSQTNTQILGSFIDQARASGFEFGVYPTGQ